MFFYRLIEQAVSTDPNPYKSMVAGEQAVSTDPNPYKSMVAGGKC